MVLCHWAVYSVIEYNPNWAPGALLPSLSWHWTDSSNRRTCQSFWSSIVALSSLRSLCYWIVAAFVCHFKPPLNHRRKRKTSSAGGKRLTSFFLLHLFTERYRRIRCHFCPTRNRSLWKEKMKGEKWLVRKGGRPTAHEVTDGEVFEVFCPFFLF